MTFSLMHLLVIIVAVAQLGASIFLNRDTAQKPSSSSHHHRSQSDRDTAHKPNASLHRHRSQSSRDTVQKLSHSLRHNKSQSRASSRRSKEQAMKPHIILVVADDMGYNSIGYNNAQIKTPTIDTLANEGVKLRSYYAAPICGPSRFSLLTGRAPWKSEAWTSNQFEMGIPAGTSLDYAMLPAALKAAGYKTHMVGKWHQGYYSQDFWPQNRGFDTFYGSLQGCVYHDTQEACEAWCNNGGRVLDLTDSTREVTADDIDTSLLADDRYRIRAVELIQNHNPEEPMFLFVSFHHPHAPLDAPEQYSSQFDFEIRIKNTYFGMLKNLDDNVEEIRKALTKAGMWDNSLVVFTSDNGGSRAGIESEIFEQELNYPLKGFKGHVHEGGIKVPSFVSGGFLPQQARGLQLDGVTSIADWYATLAGLAGAQIDQSGPYQSDSINNWKYITGEKNASARLGLVQFSGSNDYAYIEGKWKLFAMTNDNGQFLRLFDLENDPSEDHDVSAENSEIVARLKMRFEEDTYKRFLGDVDQLESCETFGFSKQAFSKNWCKLGIDTFLKDFDPDPHSYAACFAGMPGLPRHQRWYISPYS